jgi:hypothetical protein
MRMSIAIAFVLYVLITGGGSPVGPFNTNAECQSFRHDLGAGGYCLPLWQ